MRVPWCAASIIDRHPRWHSDHLGIPHGEEWSESAPIGAKKSIVLDLDALVAYLRTNPKPASHDLVGDRETHGRKGEYLYDGVFDLCLAATLRMPFPRLRCSLMTGSIFGKTLGRPSFFPSWCYNR